MSDLPLQFPVLLLIPAHIGGWDEDPHDDIQFFLNEREFNTITPSELQDEYADMRIVDVACRCWRIVGITKLGIRGTSWRKLLNFIFRNFQYRYHLEEQAPMSFEAVRDHVCATIEANPEGWRDEEAIAGESGPPREEEELFQEKIELCRRTTNMPELIDTFVNKVYF